MNSFARPLLAVAVLFLSACSVQIQHGLDERDANEIISALDARGFEARKVPEKGKKPTFAIELDEKRATEAMRVLTELKLPRPQRLKTQTLAQSVGLIETPAAERLRQLEAQEGDVEESLETMDGVTSAAVELVVPPAPRPGVTPTPSKASVLLRVHPDAVERMQQQRAELKALVAAAVDGLKADDVVLVIDPVTLPAPTVTLPSAAPSLRPLVIALGIALSVVAMLLVFLAWRLKQARKQASAAAEKAATAAAPPAPAQPARPVINPAVQRRVA
ncbi:MAG: flagellar M-ring protein FliF [Myxococcota bacterium]